MSEKTNDFDNPILTFEGKKYLIKGKLLKLANILNYSIKKEFIKNYVKNN